MLPVHVLKFGGASLQSPERMALVGNLVQGYDCEAGLVLVVSALGKTTNRLERLVEAAADQSPDFDSEWVELQHSHWAFVHELLVHEPPQLTLLFQELRQILEGVRLLGDAPPRIFDRIVAYGELLSSSLLASFLQEKGLPVAWLDARDLIRTDLNYRAARILWSVTQQAIQERILPLLIDGYVPLTQGYIARGTDGSTTTLGREGSDFSAALIGAALKAQVVSIWKDVPGVLSADPRDLGHYVELEGLTYEQALEMTFYGASVIHPNTLRPLFQSGIPLHVRSFLDPEKPGTRIDAEYHEPQPSFQLTSGVFCLVIRPYDLSFIDEVQLRQVFDLAGRKGLRSLLFARTAISLVLCFDAHFRLIDELASLIQQQFAVRLLTDLYLIVEQNFEYEFSVNPRHVHLEQKLTQARFLLVDAAGLNEWKTAYEKYFTSNG